MLNSKNPKTKFLGVLIATGLVFSVLAISTGASNLIQSSILNSKVAINKTTANKTTAGKSTANKSTVKKSTKSDKNSKNGKNAQKKTSPNKETDQIVTPKSGNKKDQKTVPQKNKDIAPQKSDQTTKSSIKNTPVTNKGKNIGGGGAGGGGAGGGGAGGGGGGVGNAIGGNNVLKPEPESKTKNPIDLLNKAGESMDDDLSNLLNSIKKPTKSTKTESTDSDLTDLLNSLKKTKTTTKSTSPSTSTTTSTPTSTSPSTSTSTPNAMEEYFRSLDSSGGSSFSGTDTGNGTYGSGIDLSAFPAADAAAAEPYFSYTNNYGMLKSIISTGKVPFAGMLNAFTENEKTGLKILFRTQDLTTLVGN